ncbi:hypothetical protein FACS189429_7910 [Bacteroidia bacterium]|nr:hypothetical protein FACS189429_7910 [Bacteroidia bacterium]
MKKVNIITVLAMFFVNLFAQNDYLHTTFQKDSLWLENKVSKIIKKSKICKKNTDCQIKYVYLFIFDDDLFNAENIKDNKYLNCVYPNYILSEYDKSSKYRLYADIYILNNQDSISGKIYSTNSYPFKFVNYTSYNDISILENVLKQEFDLVFKIWRFKKDIFLCTKHIFWCVKDNETFIYDEDSNVFCTLQEFYDCYWKEYRDASRTEVIKPSFMELLKKE